MPPTTERILLTGAAGRVAAMLRPRLARPGRVLRLLDVHPVGSSRAGEEEVVGSITDRAALAGACADVDAVVHLGGVAGEAPWSQILATNVDGTQALLDAAATVGVDKVVLASSNHAVGFWSRAEAPPGGLPDDVTPRPDTFYGWSKAADEALGRLYHDRFGIDVVSLRIGYCIERPPAVADLSWWLSPDDAGRLVEAALAPTTRGHHVVWGVSANTRRWWSRAGGDAIGYHPRDDSEVFAEALRSEQHGGAEPDLSGPEHQHLGGHFGQRPLGEPMD